MKVNITARHLELTSALKEYAEKKLLHARKFAGNIKKGHIILNVEKDRHIAEIVVSVKNHNITAKAVAGDMYAAIDVVMDKLNKQLKKHLEKIKDHRQTAPYSMVANLIWEDMDRGAAGSEPVEPQLEEVRKLDVKKQSIGDAIKTLDEKKLNFWVFREPDSENLNIVYYRKDGSHGMLIITG
ncbi:MAG: ribosome-associated translation inhibitor RaiA [Elusimicrobia bacterium]|jgi:putative sigma-54 modulation protein|nr:ribosome-associated translation inhibitor RaiA [Elusimicrobiota bacterium]